MRFGYVLLYVRDPGASLALYERALGFRKRFHTPDNTYAELQTGSVVVGFVQHALGEQAAGPVRAPRPDEAPLGASLAFVVEDVPVAYERAVRAGATPHRPPSQTAWGQTVAYVRDADGVLLELCTRMT